VSDGTTEGTQPIVDAVPGINTVIEGLTEFNGKLYFSTSDETNGEELWVTDGTAAGTNLVADINLGSRSSNPNSLTEFDGKLYFVADDGINGAELWSTDGTTAGTNLVEDINPGAGSSLARFNISNDSLTVAGNELFFVADAGEGKKLFKLADNSSVVDPVEPTPPPATSPPTLILGTPGDDVLTGTATNERIEGGRGNDILVGGAGDDILAAGEGVDVLTGGAGADTFYLGAGARTNTITDFDLNSDRLGLAGGLTVEKLNFSGENVRAGDDVLVTLTGVDTADLTASNFGTL